MKREAIFNKQFRKDLDRIKRTGRGTLDCWTSATFFDSLQPENLSWLRETSTNSDLEKLSPTLGHLLTPPHH